MSYALELHQRRSRLEEFDHVWAEAFLVTEYVPKWRSLLGDEPSLIRAYTLYPRLAWEENQEKPDARPVAAL